MSGSHRRLPHHYPEGKWLFVTWRLHGSLPSGQFPPPDKITSGEAFAAIDRYLDSASRGPLYLRQPEIAQIVLDALFHGVALGHYDLAAFVLMANHVHVLLFPKVSPSRLLQSIKGCSARQANRVLRRTGESFWHAESYDHWVRNEREFTRIVRYIENNPVKAGLANRAEEYRWSSAYDPARSDSLAPGTGLDRIVEAAD